MSGLLSIESCPRLPPELTDYTIDFLHSDVSTLCSCALTCRAWLPSAQFHLFAHLSITNTNNFSKITRITSADPHTTERVLPLIRTLYISKSNRFEPISNAPPSTTANGARDAINSAFSRNSIHWVPSDPFLIPRSQTAWETTLPRTLSAKFPSLKALHLDSFFSFWQPTGFSLVSYAAFKSIDTLSLSNSSFRSWREFEGLVTGLPGLKHLSLDSFGYGSRTGGRTRIGFGVEDGATSQSNTTSQSQEISLSDPSRPPSACHPRSDVGVSLTSLCIEHHAKPLDAIFDWLLSTPSVDTLKEISVPDLQVADIEGVQTFLGRVGGSLERFEIGFREGSVVPGEFFHFDLKTK